MKQPYVQFASRAAGVISRRMRAAGFVMADTSDRHNWTEGFHVHRVGCGSNVAVAYHHPREPVADTAVLFKKRCEEIDRAKRWLVDTGYPLADNTDGLWVRCDHP